MPDTTLKGAIAEAAIASRAIEMGIFVLRPLIEGRRYDLLFDIDQRFFRVQCKWAPRRGAVIDVHLATCRHTPRGYVYTTYGPHEVDAIAVYCQELKRCYWLPIDMVAGRRAIYLRLEPARNNQEAAINFAADHEFGAIAQLGERSAGSRKVGGSNPPSSTSRPLA
jgi:PD-(D/E)XK nuclease superfamily protein